MKRHRLLIFTIAIVASFTWLVGCSSVDDPGNGEITADDLATRTQSEDLNDPYGGFNTKDENPGFGDADLAAEFDAEDAEYNDPFSSDRDVANAERGDRKQTFLMITWGNLHRDEALTDQRTNWDGSLTVDPGVLLLKRVVRFEPHDRILPRTQRDLIEWESNTGCCIDGIVVKIHPMPTLAAADSSVDSSMVTITFDTGPLTVDFTLDQLPGLNRTITLDDGNAVSFQAITVMPNDCPNGFARGRWANHPERQGGVFNGKWETANGKVMGVIKGHYGKNDAGEKVFFGKMISRNGRFEGIIVGRYERHDGDENGGVFKGRIYNRNREPRGEIGGEWKRSPHCNGGFFRARWALKCNIDS